jgi:hypothetical protein
MNHYKARDLLNLSYEQLWALPSEWHVIEFDDGEKLLARDRITKLSVLNWYPLKAYPDVPILKEYHMGSKRVTAKSLITYLNKVIWGIHDHTNEEADPEHLARLAIETVNWLYNEATVALSPYVATLSMFDIAQVYNHPAIREANENVEESTYGIEGIAYKKIAAAFDDTTQFRGNSIIEGYRSGTQKLEQLLQAFGPRGYPTDINSDIFAHPVTVGYVDGIWDLYGSMIESRSGTKALLYNKELLRVTEYFNRKSQLIAQYVQRLHKGDCGTSILIDFPVLKSTLKALRGKYYQREDGVMDWMRGNEEHLIGKMIKMRSVLGCTHPDPAGVCSRCYGRLSFSIMRGTNIGQVSAVSMGDKITSSVLSTKHTDATSAVEQFQIAGAVARYLREGDQSETLYLKSNLANQGYRLVIKSAEATSLADVLMIKDLSAYPAESASELTHIGLIRTTDEGEDHGDILPVSLYNRKSSLSTELLCHVQRVGWITDNRDNIVIDLNGFDFSQPFLTLPYKHVNMYEFMKRVQSFLHSGDNGDGSKLSSDKVGFTSKTYLKNYKDPVDALAAFASLINEKIRLNIVHCEVLVYAMMIVSASAKDYRLPVPGVVGQFEKYNKLMDNRSLSGKLAFEKQHEPLNNPGSFLYKNRNDHPYDTAVMGGCMS